MVQESSLNSVILFSKDYKSGDYKKLKFLSRPSFLIVLSFPNCLETALSLAQSIREARRTHVDPGVAGAVTVLPLRRYANPFGDVVTVPLPPHGTFHWTLSMHSMNGAG